ncbi:MAG: 1-(5-phosphoribosyl)-5-[(5-phosphoribosylamino)methylideneamino]imidazole-4-carboxamide isomerase [Firmicutes bacterium]|nr:1-(5-phosphoribosyl)-5-[(5-phosphoribosylamino)methylideneamino]imidazole-4-carboxamide isomerase [Bacillota bacterium]
MQIYPAIDIKNGQCVRLKQGNFDDVTIYGNDPSEMAKKFVEDGASYLHIVDLDGARMGAGYNSDIIKKIVEISGIPVQTGGGIRTMCDIEERISIGVSRVILGTAAVSDPKMVRESVELYGDKIAVGIDAIDGKVAIHGWEKVSDVSAVELCGHMKEIGVKTVIYTDITKDGMMIGPNIESTKELVKVSGIDIIASGGISSMCDIEKAEKSGAAGVIIGKALYQGNINLSEAIKRFERI